MTRTSTVTVQNPRTGNLAPLSRAAVVARALELVAVDRLLLHEGFDRVRQLDLAAGAARGRLELVEDLRRQDVAPDDGEVRWSVCRRGLLDEPGDLVQPAMVQTALDRLPADYPVALRVRVGDLHDRDD